MANDESPRQALWIILGGAIGGGLSWLFTIAGGGHLGSLSTPQAVLTSILLGAGAGFIGVYVVANSDRRDLMRCLAFAVLCGFAWRVVYEGGESMLSKRQAGSDAVAGAEKTEILAQQITTNTAAPPPPAQVTALGAAATDSLHAAAKSDDPDAKKKAADASSKAIDVLATTTQPEAANSAAHIATTAVQNDQPEVAVHAILQLKKGPQTAAKLQALQEIESAAKQKNAAKVLAAFRKQ